MIKVKPNGKFSGTLVSSRVQQPSRFEFTVEKMTNEWTAQDANVDMDNNA